VVDARILHRLVLLFLLLGLGLSTYAAVEVVYHPAQSVCSFNSYVSCSRVTQSGHTTLGPVPDWAVGVGGFVLLLAIDLPLLRSFDGRLLLLLLLVALVGIGVSAYFAYVELGVIHALCPVCLGAYLADGAVLILAFALVRLRLAKGTPGPPGAGPERSEPPPSGSPEA
jgi:uncharacterized membrane protein